jgi:hypothetical protein
MGAYHGRYFKNGRWVQLEKRDCSIQELAIISGQNLKQWFENIRHEKQPSLF